MYKSDEAQTRSWHGAATTRRALARIARHGRRRIKIPPARRARRPSAAIGAAPARGQAREHGTGNPPRNREIARDWPNARNSSPK